jgi:hypothetical protein
MRPAVMVICLSGCSLIMVRSPQPSVPPSHATCSAAPPIVDASVMVLSGFFAAVALSVDHSSEVTPNGSSDDAAAALLATTAGFLLSAIYGAHEYGVCQSFNREQDEQLARARRDEEQRRDAAAREAALQRAAHDSAWQLTLQAEAAARMADCASVHALDAQVSALDREMHDTVFVRDASIARCLNGDP